MEEPYIIISQQMDNVQFSWIWFLLIPYLIFLGYITYSELRGDTMAILGMQMSGKTTMLRHMQEKELDPTYKGTRKKEIYKDIRWKIGNRTIKTVADLGGGDEWVRDNYLSLIEENDIIIFVFDASEFENNLSYRRDTLGRLDFTFEKIREKKSDVESFIKNHFALIGTHSDKISDSPISLIRKWQKDYSEKPYSKIFKNNIAVLNMTNADELNNFLNKLFL